MVRRASFILRSVFVSFIVLPAPAFAEPSNEIVASDVLERMAKEKEDRKACKTEICKAFAQPSDGQAINCSVTKTWLVSEIQAGFLGDRIKWFWGPAQCQATIDLDREAIKKAATQGNAVLKLKKHDISCKLDSKEPKEGVLYTLKLSIEPTVTFAGGKATKVEMGWGPIEAPAIAKAAIWSATEVDANFGVISNGVVREINNFLFDKCKEVGVEVKPQ